MPQRLPDYDGTKIDGKRMCQSTPTVCAVAMPTLVRVGNFLPLLVAQYQGRGAKGLVNGLGARGLFLLAQPVSNVVTALVSFCFRYSARKESRG
jgi:hypothetical protein